MLKLKILLPLVTNDPVQALYIYNSDKTKKESNLGLNTFRLYMYIFSGYKS